MSIKKVDFGLVVSEGLNSVSIESQIADAKTQFKEFLTYEVPRYVDAYEWSGREVLIKVFKYVPKSDVSIQINANGDTADAGKVRYMSFAKVLAVGPDSKYKVGDIVKLTDVSTLSIVSSKYKSWADNPMSKSNAKQLGDEPAKYVCNIHEVLGPSTFILNPFDLSTLDSYVDESIYKISDNKIENKIKDVEIFIN